MDSPADSCEPYPRMFQMRELSTRGYMCIFTGMLDDLPCDQLPSSFNYVGDETKNMCERMCIVYWE